MNLLVSYLHLASHLQYNRTWPTVARMQADFGSFGGKHVDEHDSVAGVTSMITYSDLEVDDHPGWFVVGDLGVAVGKYIWLITTTRLMPT